MKALYIRQMKFSSSSSPYCISIPGPCLPIVLVILIIRATVSESISKYFLYNRVSFFK